MRRPLSAASWLVVGVLAAASAWTVGTSLWSTDTETTAHRVAPNRYGAPTRTASGRTLSARNEEPAPSPAETPVSLDCHQARAVVHQARARLASPPPQVSAPDFAQTLTDWLDPHGMWSACPDSPVRSVIQQQSAALLAMLEGQTPPRNCSPSRTIGKALAAWIGELRKTFHEQLATSIGNDQLAWWWSSASQPAFEGGRVTTPGRALARDLGHRTAILASAIPSVEAELIERALQRRLFPDLSEEQWAGVVRAAAVRSYVMLIDPHGGWAPMDEETSLYEVELEQSGRHHMWGSMTRTAAGVLVNSEPVAPLQRHDVVVQIGPTPLAGLTVEQAQQLAILDPAEQGTSIQVVVFRRDAPMPVHLSIPTAPQAAPADMAPITRMERVRYGHGWVAVLRVPSVPDDLGMELSERLRRARRWGRLAGVLLDLRGNPGGSIDGAEDALGLFLPGAPLFPLKRRDQSVEVDYAPVPETPSRWNGPVATLVDGATASAAEMIAGALAAYRRGPVLGRNTYGKGCAQEYIIDAAGTGVLRLSTLLYALPDGTPVQRIGIPPTIPLDVRPFDGKEADLPNDLPPWRGPDVRPPSLVEPVPWPKPMGRIGPCADPVVCRALRVLAEQAGPGRRATARRKRSSSTIAGPTARRPANLPAQPAPK